MVFVSSALGVLLFICGLVNHLIVVLCHRFCTRSLLRESLDYSLIDRIPGCQNDRKTLLGELNWIFTAVTDTIAWNVLPHGNETYRVFISWCHAIEVFAYYSFFCVVITQFCILQIFFRDYSDKIC